MVSGHTKSVAIIDIKNYKLIHTKYMEFTDTIHSISLFDDETLIVALNNSQILSVKLSSLKQLKSFIIHNSLDFAYELIAKEPMLRNSAEHKELEEKFNQLYMDAVNALVHNNKILAQQLTDMFKNVPSKRVQIQQMFLAFDNYPKFKLHFLDKKYTLAYAMSSKFPALQHTPQYKKMEEIWKTAFLRAQKQVLLGKHENAKLYLTDYMTLPSKRALIQLILKENKKFIEFLKAVEEKEFLKVSKLAQENELFLQIPSYLALMGEIHEYLKYAQDCIQKGEIDEAKCYLSKLENLPVVDKKVLLLYKECEHVEKLQDAYNKSDFISCYNILDTYPTLESTQLGLLLEKHWLKIIAMCETFAQKGNIKDIKTTLGELITLPARLNKIGDLLRLSFHVQIKMLKGKKSFKKAENLIYSYIDIFGLDNEIAAIMKKFENVSSLKLAITQEQYSRRGRNEWVNSTLMV
jgi:soluble cytochrome b562